MIVIDSLRADYLGCYGFDGAISPNIDRFASESVRYTRCLSQAPWTKPSVASLFTSTHPTTHGMTSNLDSFWIRPGEVDEIEVLSDDFVTLAEALRAAGYATSARSDNPWLREINGYSQGFEEFSPSTGAGLGSTPEIARHLAGLRSQAPFFLYLHLMDVHAPYPYESAKFREFSASRSLGPTRRISDTEAGMRPSYMNKLPEGSIDLRELRDWKAIYATGVARADARFGRIYESLRRSGALEDTLVVLTSDHGEEFLEHGQWEHGRTLCNHQLRVPLLVRLPGAARAGEIDEGLVRLIDLMPTLLRIAGHDRVLPQVEGRDLFDPDGDRPSDRIALASARKGRPSLIAAQSQHAKLIWDYPKGGSRYFDLVLNPAEERAGRSIPEDSHAREELERFIRDLAKRQSRRTTRPLEKPMSEQELEQFRALGYIE
jgi:arylsulfatase A-like enzyme